jgi:hypothetical protein
MLTILILGIYANLALHVNDLREKEEQLLATAKWSNILKIWDGMASSKHYSSVTIKDFAQRDLSRGSQS